MDAQRSVSPERVDGNDLLSVTMLLAELSALTWDEPRLHIPAPRRVDEGARGDG